MRLLSGFAAAGGIPGTVYLSRIPRSLYPHYRSKYYCSDSCKLGVRLKHASSFKRNSDIMARMARVVVPRYPHHVTQRGNRRQKTFFSVADYEAYINLLTNAKIDAGVDIWAYCLMPNHVHLVVVPEQADSLSALFRDAHRRYTRRINFREKWRGHLWQERFHSCVMDENHLLATVRYTELNPVRAGLCLQPTDWAWSSACAHLQGEDDALVSVAPMLERINDWNKYLAARGSIIRLDTIREHVRTGRPLGDGAFVEELEHLTGRCLQKQKPGPKR